MNLFGNRSKKLIPIKTLVVVVTKLKNTETLKKTSCHEPYGLDMPNLACSLI